MKIALFSDGHEQPFRKEKFESQTLNPIEWLIMLLGFFSRRRKEAFCELARKKIKELQIKMGIFNGDFAESWRTERGMNTDDDLEAISDLRDSTLAQLGLPHAEFNMGNHESGYNLPLCTDSQRGINQDALRNFFQFARWKALYHSFILDGCRIAFIPYIMSEDSVRGFDLSGMKGEILFGLENDLENPGIDKVVLFVHDPDSFADPELLRIVRENRSKIKLILFGHRHSQLNVSIDGFLVRVYNFRRWMPIRWAISGMIALLKWDSGMPRKMSEYYSKRRDISDIIKELGAVLIPSPESGRFLVLDTEMMELTEYKV